MTKGRKFERNKGWDKIDTSVVADNKLHWQSLSICKFERSRPVAATIDTRSIKDYLHCPRGGEEGRRAERGNLNSRSNDGLTSPPLKRRVNGRRPPPFIYVTIIHAPRFTPTWTRWNAPPSPSPSCFPAAGPLTTPFVSGTRIVIKCHIGFLSFFFFWNIVILLFEMNKIDGNDLVWCIDVWWIF